MYFDDGHALLQTFIVGSLAYIALVVMLRLFGKRTLAKWNAFDLVVTVAFGSVLATTLLSTETALVQGILAMGLLVGLQWCITWLSVRSVTVQKWVKSQPRLLLLEGEFQEDALHQERVTESEVRAALRAQGITAIEDVEAVVLETDGTFSVMKERGSSASALEDVRGYPAPRRDIQQESPPTGPRRPPFLFRRRGQLRHLTRKDFIRPDPRIGIDNIRYHNQLIRIGVAFKLLNLLAHGLRITYRRVMQHLLRVHARGRVHQDVIRSIVCHPDARRKTYRHPPKRVSIQDLCLLRRIRRIDVESGDHIRLLELLRRLELTAIDLNRLLQRIRRKVRCKTVR